MSITEHARRQPPGHTRWVHAQADSPTTGILERTRTALAGGSPAGLLLVGAGVLASVVGTALLVAFVLWGITLDATAVATTTNPFTAAPKLLGVPQPVLGLGLLVAGSLTGAVGAAVSRRRGDAPQ